MHMRNSARSTTCCVKETAQQFADVLTRIPIPPTRENEFDAGRRLSRSCAHAQF